MVRRFESTANPNSRFEFVPEDSEEFKFNQILNLNLYREIQRNLSFSISTSWLKSPHHSGFRFAFRRSFRVSSSTERAVQVVRSNKVARKRLAESNGTPAIQVVLFLCFVLWLLFWSIHSHTQIYKQTKNRTKHTWTIYSYLMYKFLCMCYLYISLCIGVILSLFVNLCFSCVLSESWNI